jgi:outer membrane protein OmpA-like peptidoglycan-associated protein
LTGINRVKPKPGMVAGKNTLGAVMKNPRMPAIAIAVLAVIATSDVVAQNPYAADTGAQIWRNGFGECWRTGSWTSSAAIPQCDPDLVPKPTPRPAEAPRAVAPPPPPPAPVVQVVDSDGDGVPDAQDRCPGTAAGARVDAQGCELDSDRDGVVDRLDKCPGTRAGAKVDASGCEIQAVTVLKGVTFATNSAVLTPASMSILDETAATLARNPQVKAEVAGHTDNRGSATLNRQLSQRRAEAVMKYLASKGANPANLTARGYGPDQPIADNKTEQGRSANRRVELRVQP